MSSLQITWLGHSAFLIQTPADTRILTDPWLANPLCPPAWSKVENLLPLDLILVSHGHSDHLGETMRLARAAGAPVVCPFELGQFLTANGLRRIYDMGKGGTQDVAGVSITMTEAVHSGSVMHDGHIVYLGGAAGYILRQAGMPTIYFAGDTALFGDMKIIGELHKPDIAFLPIGNLYTMGPESAAMAARWLGVRQVVPMHWGTFPRLTGTPAKLKSALAGSGVHVLELAPGETAR